MLLLDDPMRGLDGFARLEQIEVLRELHRLGSTMVVAATRPEDVLEVCDTIAVLRGGRLVWTGGQAAAARPGRPTARGRRARTRRDARRVSRRASRLLGQRRDLRELEVDEDGRTVWFLFTGDQEALASLLPQLHSRRLQRRPFRDRAPFARGGAGPPVP